MASWVGHDPSAREYKRIGRALLAIGVAMFAELYAPQGVLTAAASALSITADQSALLISAATIGLAVGVLPWAWVADRIGRLTAMRISIISALIFGAVILFWPNYTGILIFRALEGLALGGVPALALTYVQEEIETTHTATVSAVYIAGTTVGGLVGRICAGLVGDAFGWRWGLVTVEALAAVAALFFILLAPTPLGFAGARRQRVPFGELLRTQLLTPPMIALYAQGFLLMGCFVTVYNYLAFRLIAPPFSAPTVLTAFLFLAYLAGTWSSTYAGRMAARFGRLRVLVASTGAMAAGLALLLVPTLWTTVLALVIVTAGFFAAHSIAAGWAPARPSVGRAQAASLYNFSYYLGSSLVGWAGGVVFTRLGWSWMIGALLCLAAAAIVAAIAALSSNAKLGWRRD